MRRKFSNAARFQFFTRILLAQALILLVVTSGSSRSPQAQIGAPDPSPEDSVRISVLGLFHPREVIVNAFPGQAIVLHFGKETLVLERSSGLDSATIRSSSDGLIVSVGSRVIPAMALACSGRGDDAVDFMLTIPDKITRHYHGTLQIQPSARSLSAVVTMDRETAVASVVAAESGPDTPLEALKAEAIAARTYLVAARGRHHDFDFCDTTHCQFLREPPATTSAAAIAASSTRALVLAYGSQPFAAMYTRSCSGRTRTPAELGLPSATYPYYSVECKYCRDHPVHWTRRISRQDASSLRSSNESARLIVDRRLGWDMIPSDAFKIEKAADHITLRGVGEGHGIGLCQAGAKAMAQDGASFQQILNHYYPNTTIISWQ